MWDGFCVRSRKTSESVPAGTVRTSDAEMAQKTPTDVHGLGTKQQPIPKTEAQTRMQEERENAKATKAQVDELLSWAQCFDKADIGTGHLIVSRLIERVDVSTGYKVHIKFRISLKAVPRSGVIL